MIRWIFTFVLLPFFSFSLTRGCNLFSSNFSSISIALHRRGEFFLWCLLCGGFFYSQLSLYRPRQAKCCLLLLTAAALLPYTPEHLPVCAILHTLLALAAALLFLYNLFYLSLQLYFSSPAPVHYSQRTSNTAFFSKLTHSLDSPATRGRLCLLLLWISIRFLSGQLDFIGNHQQRHGDLPDLNRWSTVLAVFSFIPPCTESSAFPFMILKHPHIKISTDQ